MLGQLPFKWLLETGEAKTCKLDQYAYRSCGDISLRDFNQNLMEVKPKKKVKFKVSQHDIGTAGEEISPPAGSV